jgi:hypothetical protein
LHRRFALQARLVTMAPYWLVRLNDFLAWLNPALCIVAWVLTVMVVAVAAERSSGRAASRTIQAAYPVNAPALAECPQVVLPPELRDLRLYD